MAQEQLSWLTLPDEQYRDEETSTLLAKARRNVGFLPNVFAAFTIRPSHLLGWIRHFNEVMRGESVPDKSRWIGNPVGPWVEAEQ